MILRMEYYAGPELRYLSNLDMMAMFHRALRRSHLPFALSQGYNPHIRMTLGIALPVGLWSEKEYLDLELKEDIDAHSFIEQFNRFCPPGLKILRASALKERSCSLMTLINACSYRFIFTFGEPDAEQIANTIMNREHWMINSRGKKKNQQKDLRQGIIKIETADNKSFSVLDIWAAVNEPLNVRYDELLDLLVQAGASPDKLVDIYKTGNYHQSNGTLLSPVELQEVTAWKE